nr:hypothetical protein [Tanacetum cinerariifolium]
MVVVEWKIRDYEDPVDEQEAYKWKIRDYEDPVDEQEAYSFYDETLFSLKINHGGFFTEPQGRCYTNGTFNYVDFVDADLFLVIELQEMLQTLVLETDWKSSQKLRLKEINDVAFGALARKHFKKPGLKVNSNEEATNEEASNEDETGSESSESDDSEDSDYIVDEDNVINEVDVDMQEFYQNIDKDVEWVGQSKGNVEVPAQVDVEEDFDLDDFDMDIDCDSDVESSKERKSIKSIKKGVKNKHGHFYVGQEFADKKEATALVSCQAVTTRRKLYVWKNDKLKVTAVCRGKFPNSVGPNAGGLNSPNNGKLKQVNGKWIKSKIMETSCSGQGINKVDRIRIKVENNTWTVKTYKDERTCLQTREVKLLTDKWLSNQIEDIVKPNPSIPVKALKEQLQKKYQVGISTGKVKWPRAASIMKVKGDFSEQYSLLRDYVLELQRTNEDITVKIYLERDYNPSETTRQLKRIYVCIRALKRGCKEGLRDLLGLDGCFIKGQYHGQLLTTVGIDANHAKYGSGACYFMDQ